MQDFSARDKERRKYRSDKDIEASMASHVDKFYAQIVQSEKEDGLIFKDINSSHPFFYRRCSYILPHHYESRLCVWYYHILLVLVKMIKASIIMVRKARNVLSNVISVI